jgi:hypothetical protein
MTDFFREVDEEVRRDRVIGLWKKHRYGLIAAAVLLVAGTGAWRLYSQYRDGLSQAAGAKFEEAMQLSRDGKSEEASAAFDALSKTAPKGYAGLARLRAADERAASDPQAAIKAYEDLAAGPAADPAYKDFARLRAAMLRVDTDDPAEFERKFAPFASDTFPYRYQIRELLGLAALKRNAFDTAANWFDGIVSDTRAPPGVKMRARALLEMANASTAVPGSAQAAMPPAGNQQGN